MTANRLFSILLVGLFLTATCHSDEQMTGFEEKDLPILNELLRKRQAEYHNHDSDYLNIANTTAFTPDANYEPATKKYVDDAVLWEVDGTEHQLVTADEIDMQSKKIINVTDPTTNQDAATKKYVDDTVGGITGGAWVLIETQVASNDTSIDFVTGVTGYTTYVLVISNFRIPSGGGCVVRLQFTKDAGSNWDEPNNDGHSHYQKIDSAATTYDAAAERSKGYFSIGTVIDNDEYLSGTYYITGLEIANDKTCYGTYSASMDGDCQGGTVVCVSNSTDTNWDGIRIYSSVGNITSGTFTLYGISTS